MWRVFQRCAGCFSIETLSIVAKNVLLVVNFLTLFAGILLMSTGSWVKAHEQVLLGFASSLPLVAILLGIVVTIVSCLGCVGSANDRHGVGMLRKYIISLSFLILIQILIGIIAYSQRQGIPGVIENAWQDNQNAHTVNLVQNYFQCCGLHSTNDTVAQKTNCSTIHESWALNNPPCYNVIEDNMQNSLDSLGAVGVVLGLFQFLGLMFAAILLWVIRHEAKNAYGILSDEIPLTAPQKDVEYGTNVPPGMILRTVSTQRLTTNAQSVPLDDSLTTKPF